MNRHPNDLKSGLINISTLILSAGVCFYSCSSGKDGISLPGKIARWYTDSCYVYNYSDTPVFKFTLRQNETAFCNALNWDKHGNNFYAAQYIQSATKKILRSNVVMLDSLGKCIDSLYIAQDDEITGPIFANQDGSKLLIMSHKLSSADENSLEGLMPKTDVTILDIPSKKITLTIKNLGVTPSLKIFDCPWILNENRFIYCLSNTNLAVLDNSSANTNDSQSGDVYVYDLNTDHSEILVSGAHVAACSPTNEQIAYVKKSILYVMDVKSKKETRIYEFESKRNIAHLHWTPDGEYIYIASFKNLLGLTVFSTTGEKLINVATKKEIPFKSILHGFGNYTWH